MSPGLSLKQRGDKSACDEGFSGDMDSESGYVAFVPGDLGEGHPTQSNSAEQEAVDSTLPSASTGTLRHHDSVRGQDRGQMACLNIVIASLQSCS